MWPFLALPHSEWRNKFNFNDFGGFSCLFSIAIIDQSQFGTFINSLENNFCIFQTATDRNYSVSKDIYGVLLRMHSV